MLYVFGRFAFLAFAEWIVDKMQLAKVLRLANISLKTVGGLQRVVEFLSFKDGLPGILDSPIFMLKSFWVDVCALFDDKNQKLNLAAQNARAPVAVKFKTQANLMKNFNDKSQS